MRILVIFGLALLAVQQCTAPPVAEKKDEEKEHAEHIEKDDISNFEYNRYLKEVVSALESDPGFRERLENADQEEIKSGKFAEHLELVNYSVRTQLDEIKRKEVERLRHLATETFEKEHGLDLDHLKVREHLDHENPHTFEIVDLKKLITKTSQDLAEVDRRRRKEFEEYEMQQRYAEEEKKKKMPEEDRKKYEAELEALKKKTSTHAPIHHPGSYQQLEEVWEETDHMDKNSFNVQTFFYMHDIDGNGVWDPHEVNTLFLKELDKIYRQDISAADKRRRHEEMERMREHVFSEYDANKDGLISLAEFSQASEKPEFQKDSGWAALDETQVYTEEEYANFERLRHEEEQRRMGMGVSPPAHETEDLGHQEPSPPAHENEDLGHQEPSPPAHENKDLGHQEPPPQYNSIPIDHGVPHQDFVPPMPPRVPPNQEQHYAGQPPHQQQQFHGQPPQYQGQPLQYQGQQPQFQGYQQGYQGQVPQYQGQQNIPQYQGQQQVHQYQGYPAQGQIVQQNYQGQVPPPQYQQGQLPQQQQGQVVQQQPGQVAQQQPGQVAQQQQGQVAQQQQGQVSQQQQQQGQVPQQQQGQVPPQQQQTQIPPQQQKPVPAQQQPPQLHQDSHENKQQQSNQGQATNTQVPQQPNKNSLPSKDNAAAPSLNTIKT